MDAAATPLPDLVLWRSDRCHLCEDTTALVEQLLEQRAAAGRAVPRLVVRRIAEDPDVERALFEQVPVLEVARAPPRPGRPARPRSGRSSTRRTPDGRGSDLTPPGRLRRRPPQLPLAVRAAPRARLHRAAHGGRGRRAARTPTPSRWLAVRHAIAYVLGFGAVFTILGITATFVGGPLADYLPALRTIGGVLLIVMGLNLAGHPARSPRSTGPGGRSRRARRARSRRRRARSRSPTPGAESGPGLGERLGGRLVGGRGGIVASFGLGVVFAIGWTPCIGIILGSILTVAASSGTTLQGGLLLVAYTLGLGVPFILLGVVYDRAPALVRPLVRHGRAVSFVGGLLVAVIGVFMLMDWLESWFSRLAPGSRQRVTGPRRRPAGDRVAASSAHSPAASSPPRWSSCSRRRSSSSSRRSPS